MNTIPARKKLSRLLWITASLFAMAILLFALRYTILRGLASFLIVDYTPQPSEVLIVLSGNAFDRGRYAAELAEKGVSKLVVCTGGNKDPNALVLGKDFYECELTELAVKKFCSDTTIHIDTLCRGTSTLEECQHIKELCEQKRWKHITIVSSAFHTRRIKMTCKKVFGKSDLQIDIAPAPPRSYDPMEWWKNEYGLIDLNNEYVKLFYYLFK